MHDLRAIFLNSMAKLILIRHGKTEWNKLGKWTGHAESDLIEEGIADAKRAGESLKDIFIDCAFVSDLRRAQQTFTQICNTLGKDIKSVIHPAIKERNYGVYTGKNKWEIKEQVGEEEFQKLRRGWDVPIPEGESLKDVYARVIPYYESQIKPELLAGKNIAVVSSGNALRALVKYLEHIPDEKIAELEFGLGEVYVYTMDSAGGITSKEIRAANEMKGKV